MFKYIENCLVYHNDNACVLPQLDKVDAIITDPPYGITVAHWDQKLDLDRMWELFKPLCKNEHTPCVCFCKQPFTTDLISSNRKWFRYMWYWDKSHKTNFMFAHKMPMAQVEEIAVFSEKMCVYYPQVDKSKIDNTPTSRKPHGSVLYRINIFTPSVKNQGLPSNLLCFPQQVTGFTGLQREHPTQKPESLMRYLVRTYTKEGETVLDPYMGSGTTGVACALEGRKFIGIEKEEKFFDIAVRRIEETYRKNKEFLDFGEVKE